MIKQLQKSRFEILEEYKELPFIERTLVRQIASQSLVEAGAQEVGTSDVHNEIINLYNRFGDFDLIIEDFYPDQKYWSVH